MTYRQKWTKKYGEIPSGYIIHHLNFRHTDNRMDNLIMLPSKLHYRFHFLARHFKDNKEHLKEVLQRDKFLTEEYLKIMLKYNKKWNKTFIVDCLIKNAPKTFLSYGSN